MKTLEPGQVFAEKYRVVRCIASGGMGAVYEVVHAETERTLALKVLLPTFVDRVELRDRFRTEARITAPIQSEAIVHVYDAGVDPETSMPFLTMELLRGEPLDKRLERAHRLPAGTVCAYLMQLAHALDKTHAAQIVHRDLKPENLFLTRKEDGSEQVKILDFGLAKIIEENSARAPTTSSVGTPLYMAPEQFRSGQISPATDLHALAMLAYTMLVGIPYWHEEAREQRTLVAFAMSVVGGPKEPASVRAARTGVALSPAFDAWFARMTAADPANRPKRASDAVADLAEALEVLLPAGLSSPGISTTSGLDVVAARSDNLGSLSSRHGAAMSATLAGPSGSRASRGFGKWVGLGVAVALVAAVTFFLVARPTTSGAPAVGLAPDRSVTVAGHPSASADVIAATVAVADASAGEADAQSPKASSEPSSEPNPPRPVPAHTTRSPRPVPSATAPPPAPSGRSPVYTRE